jgi:hypothetical protein
MRLAGAVLSISLLAGAFMYQPASAYVVDNKKIIYADEENSSGYRRLTSVEPAAGNAAPLSKITTYPEPDQPGHFDITYKEGQGTDAENKNSTVILHTNIPIQP